jgi:hypothetical protein
MTLYEFEQGRIIRIIRPWFVSYVLGLSTSYPNDSCVFVFFYKLCVPFIILNVHTPLTFLAVIKLVRIINLINGPFVNYN